MRRKVRLFHLFSRAQRLAYQAAERASLADLGVTPVQLGLLYSLDRGEPAAMAEVGRQLDLSPAALSGLVTRMEEAGLVTRTRDPDDARAVRLRSTPQGEAVRERSRPFLKAFNADLVAGLNEAERAAVVKFLDSIVLRFGAASHAGDQNDRARRR